MSLSKLLWTQSTKQIFKKDEKIVAAVSLFNDLY